MFRTSFDLMIADAAERILDDAGSGVLDESDDRFLERCIESTLNEAERRGSLGILCGILKRIHGRNALILVDEYDRCMQDIRSGADLDAISGFLGSFMEQSFKFNTDCEFAVIVGIMPLGRTGMLSGFNNAVVCSILETEGDRYFGFTEGEVIRLIEETGSPPEKISEVREWYCGYRFGDADVYNPYSVMMYLGNGYRPLAYWNNMTGGTMSDDLVASMSAESLSALIGLYGSEGSSFETVLDTRISGPDVFSPVAEPYVVYSYLAIAGYLRAVRVGTRDGLPLCRVSMANREVSAAFKRLGDRATRIGKMTADIVRSILRRDAETLEEYIESILYGLRPDAGWSRLDPVSRCRRYRDVIVSRLMLPGRSARPEFPERRGLSGIFFERDGDRPALVIEMTATNNPDADLASLAEKALAQIDGNGYPEDAVRVGLGIRQKSVKVAFAKE